MDVFVLSPSTIPLTQYEMYIFSNQLAGILLMVPFGISNCTKLFPVCYYILLLAM